MVVSKNYKNIEKSFSNKNSHLRIMIDFLEKKIKPNILEFGVERGGSTTGFTWIAEKIDGQVYSVDIADCSDVVVSKNWQFIQSNDLDYQFILKKFNKIESEGLDLIYIDSYHENNHVIKLLKFWFKYLKKGGAIFIDDIDSIPFRKKKDMWNSIVYDLINEAVKNFYYNNNEKIFYTKYFGESGLAKFEKLTEFLDMPNENKYIWTYSYLSKFSYSFLRKLRKILRKVFKF